MGRLPICSFVLLTIVVIGCSAARVSSASEAASVPEPSPSLSARPSVSAVERRTLPEGFPVLPGAIAVAMPVDDPGLIGLWETEQLGSAAYDYYVTALPATEFPIVGLYPGGDVALIRFQAMNREVWQLIAHASADGGTAIEVRLDRP